MSRPALIHALARAIDELTIWGRSNYDSDQCAAQLIKGNEATHRLAGHLRDLLDDREPFTDSRLGGIIDQLSLLPPSALDRILP